MWVVDEKLIINELGPKDGADTHDKYKGACKYRGRTPELKITKKKSLVLARADTTQQEVNKNMT